MIGYTPPMRRLIVNADDLGITPARSHGIFLCFEQGIVRSATLVANGSDSNAAARHARERGLPTGLHLNFTEGYPLSKPETIETLIESSGEFFGRDRLRRLLEEGSVDKAHIEREVRSQIEWFLDSHGPMTHLDSHHHIHIHPAIVPLLLPILSRYAVRFVRIPWEPLPPEGWEITPEKLERTKEICEQARAARVLYESEGIGSTGHFRGLALSGQASKKNLRHIIAKLPQGATELMVHPGSQAAVGTEFDIDPQRQTELQMLLDEKTMAMLQEQKIEVGSFGDL